MYWEWETETENTKIEVERKIQKNYLILFTPAIPIPPNPESLSHFPIPTSLTPPCSLVCAVCASAGGGDDMDTTDGGAGAAAPVAPAEGTTGKNC